MSLTLWEICRSRCRSLGIAIGLRVQGSNTGSGRDFSVLRNGQPALCSVGTGFLLRR